MDLCSFNHNEICYDETECPACTILIKNEELEKKIENLEEKIEEIESKFSDLGIE